MDPIPTATCVTCCSVGRSLICEDFSNNLILKRKRLEHTSELRLEVILYELISSGYIGLITKWG